MSECAFLNPLAFTSKLLTAVASHRRPVEDDNDTSEAYAKVCSCRDQIKPRQMIQCYDKHVRDIVLSSELPACCVDLMKN